MNILCQMTIGFLIPRACENKARFACTKCGRAICTEHAVILDSGVVCEACHLGFESAIAPGQMAQRLAGYTAADAAAFAAADSADSSLFDDLS